MRRKSLRQSYRVNCKASDARTNKTPEGTVGNHAAAAGSKVSTGIDTGTGGSNCCNNRGKGNRNNSGSRKRNSGIRRDETLCGKICISRYCCSAVSGKFRYCTGRERKS